MGRKNSRTRAKKADRDLLSKGISAVTLGVVFLFVPFFLGGSAPLRAVGQGLRVPALFALAIGAVLIALHVLLRPNPQQPSTAKRQPAWEQPVPAPQPRAQPPQERLEPSSTSAMQATQLGNTRTSADEWGPKVFEAIEWRRFEAVCERLFGQAGFEARTQSHGADGGVDIWLHSRHSEGAAAIVQCKHWQGKQVGVKELREFYGVMASHKLKRGTYATTSTYTADATLFAKENGISALDGNALLALIARRTPEQQMELLQTAYEGEYWRPTCASCGVKMVEREKKKDKAPFSGAALVTRNVRQLCRCDGLPSGGVGVGIHFSGPRP